MKRGIGLRYAASGLLQAVRAERNMRIHAAAALVAIALAAYAGLDRSGWLWVLLAITLVISAECMNSALERVVDIATGGERQTLAKAAKDMAAGAVLVAALFSLAVAGFVLVPAVWMRIVGSA